jgi:hypothetical protein
MFVLNFKRNCELTDKAEISLGVGIGKLINLKFLDLNLSYFNSKIIK